MLLINNKEYKVLSSEIKFVNSVHNKIDGVSILVSLDIELEKVKGYVSFYVDFFNDNDFKNIENKTYRELPTDLKSKITMIEIYDTKDFVDYIDSIVELEFGYIKNNMIEMSLIIDDENIKLDYKGNLVLK